MQYNTKIYIINNMKNVNKKALYEMIMKSVSKEVKKYLNEHYNTNINWTVDADIDEYNVKMAFIEKGCSFSGNSWGEGPEEGEFNLLDARQARRWNKISSVIDGECSHFFDAKFHLCITNKNRNYCALVKVEGIDGLTPIVTSLEDVSGFMPNTVLPTNVWEFILEQIDKDYNYSYLEVDVFADSFIDNV